MRPRGNAPRTAAAAATILLMSCCLLAVAGQAGDELVKVRIEASAPGSGVAARDEAVRNAQRQIVSMILEAELAPCYLPQTEPFIGKAHEYFRSIQVVRQQSEENRTAVEVESLVYRKRLLEDAARFLLPRMADPPTVSLLVVERIGATGEVVPGQGTAEAELAKALEKAGLALAGAEDTRARYAPADLAAKILGDVEAASQFAREHLADVVILGESVSTEERSGASANVLANTAAVTLRVFRSSDGKLIEAFAREARVHATDGAEGRRWAIRDACEKIAGEAFLACLLAVIGSPFQDDVVITVERPGSRVRFGEFVDTLKVTAGVGEVEELFYSPGMARIRVEYEGSMAELVDSLAGKPYDGQTLYTRKAVHRTLILGFE